MKTIKIITIALTILLSTNVFGQLKVLSNGTTVTKKLTVEPGSYYSCSFGSYSTEPTFFPNYYNCGYIGLSSQYWYKGYIKYMYASSYSTTSDKRLKKNIKDLNTGWAIATISQLKPKKYDMISDPSKFEKKKWDKIEKYNQNQFGLLAQDVEKIIPQIVHTEDDSLGTKSINYDAFIPLLISAIQEQQKEIESLKTKKKSTDEVISFKSSSNLDASLGQNTPNPFSENTEIQFYLSSDISSAMLNIYDLQGKQIRSLDIVERESASVTIYADELQPGMYKYALIADGQIVGTETMILTD